MFPFKAVGKVVGVIPTRDQSGCYVKVECKMPREANLGRDCEEGSFDILFPIATASQVAYGATVEVDGEFYCYNRRKRKADNSGDMIFTHYVFHGKTVKTQKAA